MSGTDSEEGPLDYKTDGATCTNFLCLAYIYVK